MVWSCGSVSGLAVRSVFALFYGLFVVWEVDFTAKDRALCIHCGEVLEGDRAVLGCAVCMDCQQTIFARLEEKNGCHMAIFLACGMFDLPCVPELVPENFCDFEGSRWARYCELLGEWDGMVKADGSACGFLDGVCDVRRVFGRNVTEKDFGRYIAVEKEHLARLPGTAEQRARWGTDDMWKGLMMTTEVYDALDKQYESRASEFRGQTLSMQQKDAIVKVCKWNMVIDHLYKMGNVDAAQKIQRMVQIELESEQMRKKDEKPTEQLRVDALAVALEDAGLMESGDFLNCDELIEVMRDRFVKSKKYGYSLDAADQMIFDYVNNLRANADLALLSSLPEGLEIQDEYGEFEAEETEEEKRRKQYAGLVKVQFDSEG